MLCAALVCFHFCVIFHILSHGMLLRSISSCLLSLDIWMISSFLLVRWWYEHSRTCLLIHMCVSFFSRVYSQEWNCCWQISVFFFPSVGKYYTKKLVCVCVRIPESSNLTVYIPFGSTFLKMSSTGFFLSLSFSEAHKSLWCSLHCNFPFFLLLYLNRMSSALLSTMSTKVLSFSCWTMITRFARKHTFLPLDSPLLEFPAQCGFWINVILYLYIRFTLIFFLNIFFIFKVN